MRIVLIRSNLVRLLALAPLLSLPVCRAQAALRDAAAVQVGVKLSPEVERRVEVMVRNRSGVPPDCSIAIGVPTASDIAGFDQVTITFSEDGAQDKSLPFYISTDGSKLAQFNKFDMSADPRTTLSQAGRPARGGDEHAPVLIVGFDDLECPFCARLNAELFPAILDRYKDEVRVVYRDFPLPEDQHPWAMHAAVDANCLAAATPAGYWSYVDYVHAHAAEMGADEKSLAASEKQLDKLALDEGARQGIDQPELVACVLKQDTSGIKASVAEGEADPLRVGSTPTLYINGEKVEGVVTFETLCRIIDRALIAEGRTPPAPAAPAPPAQAGADQSPPAATVQTKPGS
jgi:protein-disulfide isomerase